MLFSFQDKEVLNTAGAISNREIKEKVEEIYEEFDARRKQFALEQEDHLELQEVEDLIKKYSNHQ